MKSKVTGESYTQVQVSLWRQCMELESSTATRILRNTFTI